MNANQSIKKAKKHEFEAAIKKKQSGEIYMELIFNECLYEFEEGVDFVRNEKDHNIVALTYAGIMKIANEENIVFETKKWEKLAYNHITVHVVATLPNGVSREAIVGRNKDNMQSDGKGDEDTVAHKKACVEAFLALYGIASSRFNIVSGKAEPKKSSAGINMSVVDANENHSHAEQNAPVADTTNTTNTTDTTDAHDDSVVEMPFGIYRGQKIHELLASDTEGKVLEYFQRLFAKNEAIKNNRTVSNAIFAYFDRNGVTTQQKEILDAIRASIS